MPALLCGTATVRVAVGDKTASCTVNVVQSATSISLNKSSISLDAFEEYKLMATIKVSAKDGSGNQIKKATGTELADQTERYF